MYSGTWIDNSTIPGWYKCDGNNGTVNLVDKFVRGGIASGASGGSDDAVVVEHLHTMKTYYTAGTTNPYIPKPVTGLSASYHYSTDLEGVSGVGANIPAYYTLIFIQRIS